MPNHNRLIDKAHRGNNFLSISLAGKYCNGNTESFTPPSTWERHAVGRVLDDIREVANGCINDVPLCKSLSFLFGKEGWQTRRLGVWDPG